MKKLTAKQTKWILPLLMPGACLRDGEFYGRPCCIACLPTLASKPFMVGILA